MAEDESDSSTENSAGGESARPGSSGTSGGGSASSSASAAFSAGRAERREGTSDGGVARNAGTGNASTGDAEHAGGGPHEAPTVEHARPSGDDRTEVVSSSAGAQGSPTAVQQRPEFPPQQAQGAPARSGPSAVGGAVRRVLGLLATLVALAGLLCALVLVAFVVLRLVAIDPQNVVAQAVDAIADRLVGPFRDLFLVPNPVGIAVNYGLAALCWLVAGLIVARILRAVGRVFP